MAPVLNGNASLSRGTMPTGSNIRPLLLSQMLAPASGVISLTSGLEDGSVFQYAVTQSPSGVSGMYYFVGSTGGTGKAMYALSSDGDPTGSVLVNSSYDARQQAVRATPMHTV